MSSGLRASRSLLTLGHKKTRFAWNRVKPNCYAWCVVKHGGQVSPPCSKFKGGLINAPAQARLLGWIRHRLKKSTKTWVHLDPATFCQATGLSRRSFFYAKKILERQGRGVVFRTVTISPQRGWRILVSDTAGFLYKRTAEGSRRRLKSSLRGTECKPLIRNTTCSRQTTSTVRGLGLSPPQRRLAHALKRKLEWSHWDNCKVRYSPGMAYNYASELIALSHEDTEIVGFYERALHECHQMATDSGSHYAASSTVHRARICAARARAKKHGFGSRAPDGGIEVGESGRVGCETAATISPQCLV